MRYCVLQNNETKGPYTMGQLRSMWNSGMLTGDMLYCEEGCKDWSQGWLPLKNLANQLEVSNQSERQELNIQPQRQEPIIQARSGVADGVKIGFGMFVILPIIIIIVGFILLLVLGSL